MPGTFNARQDDREVKCKDMDIHHGEKYIYIHDFKAVLFINAGKRNVFRPLGKTWYRVVTLRIMVKSGRRSTCRV